jgi:transposase
MLTEHGHTLQQFAQAVPIGVGIDTSRYGHYAAFLQDQLQPAAAELQFPESAAGYTQLRKRLERIAQHYPAVHFLIRLDAAGQYAENLMHFLHQLQADLTEARPLANATFTFSCGDPQRNKNYRAALYGAKKSDPVEARAAARYALSERPTPAPALPTELRAVRQVASRLQAVVRQRTRLINQFHQLLALAFPELALVVKDISAGWVLELVHRYPTAPLLAAADELLLADIPYLPKKHIAALLKHARASVASLTDDTTAELIRDQVRQLRDVRARQKRQEKLLVDAYHRLPKPNHVDTIGGIGDVTAAVLTAFILDIDRFETPGKLVAYFGAIPTEVGSGVDRDGQAREAHRYLMSKRGNDLVRRYLWMAALSAVQHNPAVKPLYARVVAKHPDHKAIAIGHAMRKLLHLVFAVWKTDKPFDPEHYHWTTPRHVAESATKNAKDGSDLHMSAKEQVAGLKPDVPAQTEVTATCKASVTEATAVDDKTFLDFAHLKGQLPMERVLDHLGLSSRLRGSGSQRKGPCPIHGGDARGRTFSVNLGDGVFCCFDKRCGKKGDVIDLWASVNVMSLREAALDLVNTFHLEPAPKKGTEKRHG